MLVLWEEVEVGSAHRARAILGRPSHRVGIGRVLCLEGGDVSIMRSRLWSFLGLVGLLGSLVLLPACGEQLPPGSLPVYGVTSSPIVTPEKADKLADALGLPGGVDILDEDGAVAYLDADLFLAVPMTAIVELTALVDETGDEPPVGPFQAFDFAAINQLEPIGDSTALAKVAGALQFAGLTPTGLGIGGLAATPGVSFASFEAFDIKEDKVIATALLDGQVAYELKLGQQRLVGPGAKVQVSLNGAGTPTQVAYALRGLQRVGHVQVVSSAQAAAHAEALYLAANPSASAAEVEYACEEVVYFAPPLSLDSVAALYPHYDCSGTATTGGIDVQQVTNTVQLLQYFVPAIEDVPEVALTAAIGAGIDGPALSYTATITGGTAPYTIDVSSGTTEYQETFTVTSTKTDSYPVYSYSWKTEDPIAVERVTVTVTDANGLIGVPASRDVAIPNGIFMGLRAPTLAPSAVSVIDVGVTRGVCDMGAGLQNGFVNRMLLEPSSSMKPIVRFNWACQSSWERDFREGGTGLDYQVVDNVDLALYIGHGWPGGFTFDNANETDGALRHTDGARWGNQDLEWLALVSCQVLRYYSADSGGYWYQRWGQEFDGLHMILGFHTNAYDWSGFGHRFADWMLGRKIGFVTVPPLPIRAAWFQATKEQQPKGVVAAVMGVYGMNGVTSYNDHFWGKGPVSPDLRQGQYAGWWYVQGP